MPVTVNPGPPNSISLTLNHEFRLANGVSTATADARVLDQYDNPISGLPVTFTVDGVPSTVMTDSTGVARKVIGPYWDTHTANITASYGGSSVPGTVRFLDKDNLILVRTPAASMPIDSDAGVDAYFYEDLGLDIPAVGVPLSFTAYGPDFAVLGTYSGVTDPDGKITFNFHMSKLTGNNTIVVTNDDMGGTIKSTIISGKGGNVSNIILTADPGTPVYADGTSGYTLNIWVKDSGGNPVKNEQLSVIKNSNTNYTYYPDPTNNNGYTSLAIPASRFVCNDNYTVIADNSVNKSIILSYLAGSPAAISVVANPNAVANANVSTPPGSPDVHSTDIIATVTDQWGHPIGGEPVTITSENTTLGNITGPASGTTLDSGEFTTQFTLSDSNYGSDTDVGAPVRAVSGSLSGLTHVLYTEESFLSIKTSIYPKSNLSINDTINVTIDVKGIGWKIRGQGYDIALIFDSSGSMDWLSTTVDPPGLITGTMAHDGTRHNIMTFHNDRVQDIEIMVSSSYRNYANGSYYDNLMIKGPPTSHGSLTTYTGTNSANENYEIITNAPVGDYTVSAEFIYRSAGGTPPYNAMVLVDPKRLGGSGVDLDSAAKVAAREFVDNMTDNQVSVIWFNSSHSGQSKDSGVAIHLKTVDSSNKTSINKAINSLNAYYGTEIGAGISEAINELTGPYSNKSNKKVAILLSDGYSQTPANDITQANNAKNKNITIFTVGMGMPDDEVLGSIANITGGNYTKVISSDELKHVYGNIASELNKVIASQTDMHIITNSTVINGTLYPDAEYMPGSAWVTYPNGTSVQEEPTINTDGAYDLRWNPGVIKLNDTWTLNYQLKILRNGTIEPITNQSHISFTREDGTNDTASFQVEMLFVGGGSGDDVDVNSPLKVVITDPTEDPYNTSTQAQIIKWDVNYTGSYTYEQKVIVDSVVVKDNGFVGVVKNSTTKSYEIPIDLTPGEHLVEIMAIEDINGSPGADANDTIRLRLVYNKGQITLE